MLVLAVYAIVIKGSGERLGNLTRSPVESSCRHRGWLILSTTKGRGVMDWKIELVAIPVSDVDRAKDFYTEKVGFNLDHDHRVSDEVRFVQLTPPGSA